MQLLLREISGNKKQPDTWISVVLFAAQSSILSLCFTGYEFGTNNNLFHLAIVGSLFDEPQYAHDVFIQSLHYFSSGLWLFMSHIHSIQATRILFLVLDYVSRYLSCLGLLLCAVLLGVKEWKYIALFSFSLALTPLLQGYSFAGGGGLFINYFTHSELDNGLSMIMIALLIRRDICKAIALNGLIFFINAFVAAWNFAPIAVMTAMLLMEKRTPVRKLMRDWAVGISAFIFFALPIFKDIITNPSFGHRLNFDYVAFLQEYWPYHFLFNSISLQEKIHFMLVTAIAVLSFIALKKYSEEAQKFQCILLSYLAVYFIGIIVPHITHNTFILNLHLLRVGVMIHMLAALGVIVLIVHWLKDRTFAHSIPVLPAILLLTACTIQPLLFAAPCIIGLTLLPMLQNTVSNFRPAKSILLTYGILTCGLLLCFWHIRKIHTLDAIDNSFIAEWKQVGDWAVAHTNPEATFLIPTSDIKLNTAASANNVLHHSEIFEFTSHRKIWIDFKRGAAVMWYPAYYPVWHSRITEVLALKNYQEKMRYAVNNGIAYIIDSCSEGHVPALYSSGQLCVFSTKGDQSFASKTPLSHKVIHS